MAFSLPRARVRVNKGGPDPDPWIRRSSGSMDLDPSDRVPSGESTGTWFWRFGGLGHFPSPGPCRPLSGYCMIPVINPLLSVISRKPLFTFITFMGLLSSLFGQCILW